MTVSRGIRERVPSEELPRCASCRSTWIYHRVSDGLWKCRSCEGTFKSPLTAETMSRANGSGVVAPMTYRSMLARGL